MSDRFTCLAFWSWEAVVSETAPILILLASLSSSEQTPLVPEQQNQDMAVTSDLMSTTGSREELLESSAQELLETSEIKPGEVGKYFKILANLPLRGGVNQWMIQSSPYSLSSNEITFPGGLEEVLNN